MGALWWGLCPVNVVLRGSGTTDRVATDRVIVALGLERDNSNGTLVAISRRGVTAIGTALRESCSPGFSHHSSNWREVSDILASHRMPVCLTLCAKVLAVTILV